jgi:hypothetical protein
MNTAKEFASIKRLQAERDGALRYARSVQDGTFNGYKNPKGIIRAQVRRARQHNAKLVALKAAGSVRPVTVVMQALLPLITEAREHGAQYAREDIAAVAADLAAHGWDLTQAAPTSYKTLWDRGERAAQQQRNAKHAFYAKLTQPVSKGYRSPGEPDLRAMDADAGARYVLECVENAESSYLAFVFKMDAKAGPCTAARIEGSHVWSYSHLYVTTAAGDKQTWHTKQITNRSCLGKYFPQWPSRLLK